MNLLSPWSLLLFLPLGGIIVLLYLLKLKRKEQMVSSVMLWQDAVADIQANAPFQKLKKSLLLLLQLLVLLMLVGALARPFTRTKGISESKIVIILDSSASMQATDVSPSRFEKAKAQALDIVKRMGHRDTMLVMTVGSKARVVASFTSDKKSLAGAISRLKPADTHCNLRQAMVMALSLVAGKSTAPPRIVVLSDGGFDALTDLAAGKAKLDFIRLGKGCDNVAITGMASRKTLAGEQQVFIGLRNFSERERAFNLEIYLNDRMFEIREEKLGPGETRQEILENVSGLNGRITVKLDISDDLAVDNTGWVFLAKPRKIDALLVTRGNVFLENALNLDPRTQLVKADALPADFASRKYDLVVFDGIKPPNHLPPGGYLLVNTSAVQGPAEIGEAVSRPVIVDSARNHPASAYVDFADMRIAEAHRLKPREWATTIVESTDGPIGLAGSANGRSFVHLSFDLLESDFPLRVGFPIFIANCLDWLTSSNGTGIQSVRTGQPAYIDVPPNTSELKVTGPDGREQTVNVTQTPVIYDDTDKAGVYFVRGKGIEKEFACNLSSSQESNILPKKAVIVGQKSFSSSTKLVQTNREFYGPLIVLALCLLALEWYAYHRRL